MNALPVTVFSLALLPTAVPAEILALPDVSAWMEIVDDEDLEQTEVVATLAGWTDPRFSERPTERLAICAEAVLVG